MDNLLVFNVISSDDEDFVRVFPESDLKITAFRKAPKSFQGTVRARNFEIFNALEELKNFHVLDPMLINMREVCVIVNVKKEFHASTLKNPRCYRVSSLHRRDRRRARWHRCRGLRA